MDHQLISVVEKTTEAVPDFLVGEFSTRNEVSVRYELLMDGLELKLPATRPMMTELNIPEDHATLFAY